MASSTVGESVSETHSGKKGRKAKAEGELMFFLIADIFWGGGEVYREHLRKV